ncbi:MAG: undecaprenyl/decaprenyl-phosphate alpha-N-acetylglucosaminyl 1-phosphate transferase [Synergistaceae bacterium]|nr:undecaprenyl/decaprenyl-phosphate alpha-N-acetylglucosaminyl 1-phosphate transferase [Synergistaceae bacterium]
MIDVRLFMLGLCGFFWGGMTTPYSIRLAQRYGIMDVPDARKIHTVQMPRGGGLGLWTGYLLLALCLARRYPFLRFSATGAAIIFLCGYLDDMRSLSPFPRLGLHFVAASLATLPLGLPPLTAAVCVIWVAGVTSAYNLIDGVNGLCISLFIAAACALCWLRGGLGSSVGVCMGAMALGVLCWNFPKAQTFLGDGGSTLLGYLFATHFMASALPRLRPGFHELILLLLLFGGVPVLDTLVAFSRRILTGKSPFYPDKGHLHHLLMRLTGSALWSVIVLWVLQALTLAAGVTVYWRLIGR